MKTIHILLPLTFLSGIHCYDCRFNTGDLGSNQPLLIKRSTAFYLPDKYVQFNFDSGDQIDFACQYGFLNFPGSLVTAQCTQGNLFSIGQNNWRIRDIQCKATNYPQIVHTNMRCYPHGEIIEIGFHVGNKFIRSIQICHEATTLTNHYAHHFVHQSSKKGHNELAKPFFNKAEFDGVDCSYNKSRQIEILKDLLGPNDYVKTTGDFFFARGHLAAHIDFALAPLQNSTYFYLNTAPTWQKLNGGNWKRFESSVRNLAFKRNYDLEVYTGTYGISQLPNATNYLKSLYLNCLQSTTHIYDKMPVPRLIYKIVIDGRQNRGVVLISVNNIYLQLSQIMQTEIICNDILDRITWINVTGSHFREFQRGYSYACEVADFLRTVNILPNFRPLSLLDN